MSFWDTILQAFGFKDFVYFISSSQLQDYLFGAKIIFVTFAFFFLAGVIYFMINSSWLQYKFLEDTAEFFSWKSYGLRVISKRWSKIKKRAESGADADLKLAIIDADDFLGQILDQAGYEGESFDESVKKAGRLLDSIYSEVISAHEMRNSIVYNPDLKLDTENAKKILSVYETAINSIGAG